MTKDRAVEGLFMHVVSGDIPTDDALREIVSLLHATREPDFDLIADVGVGPLETLLHKGHEQELWPQIEELARTDERFRRALSCCWAYDSPTFDRREALLEELGEYRTVTVRFVIEPLTFDDRDGFTWRALEVEGSPARPYLAGLLRAIAAHLEAEDQST